MKSLSRKLQKLKPRNLKHCVLDAATTGRPQCNRAVDPEPTTWQGSKATWVCPKKFVGRYRLEM